jgi:hypothetical protein
MHLKEARHFTNSRMYVVGAIKMPIDSVFSILDQAFYLYWFHCFVLTIALCSLVLCAEKLTQWGPPMFFRLPLALAKIATNRPRSILWKVVLVVAFGHFIIYLAAPNFRDPGEPTMPLLAANLLNGDSVYGSLHDKSEIVGSNYGPLIFLLQAIALWIHPTLISSKLVGIFFGVASLACMFAVARDITHSNADALAASALFVAMVSFYEHFWFWNRPDSVLIAIAACACLLHSRLAPMHVLIFVGLLAGLAINLKLFGAMYLVPFAIAAASQLTVSRLSKAVIAGGILFIGMVAFPFFIRGVNVVPYTENILIMRNQGAILWGIYPTFWYGALILLFPLVNYYTHKVSRENKVLMISLIFAMAVTAFATLKPGAGAGYLMSFVPTAIYLGLRIQQSDEALSPGRARNVLPALAICVLLGAFPICLESYYRISKQLWHGKEELAKRSELRELFLRFPQAEMGHGDGPNDSADEYYRSQRAFLGQSTHFDHVNYTDQRKAGLGTERIVSLLQDCRIPAWIFARSGGRFTGRAYDVELFDEDVRRQFETNYRLVYTGRFYEVWNCHPTEAR